MRGRRITSLGQLRPAVSEGQELEWFFNRAECDMGNQSNFLGMLGRLGPGSGLPSPEDAAEAAHRARRIRRWLTAMDASDAGVLQCAYVLRDWPVALWDQLGRLTGIVVRLACALDDLPDDPRTREIMEMGRADWLATRAPADATVVRLRREAEARFALAHRAYRFLRSRGGRS